MRDTELGRIVRILRRRRRWRQEDCAVRAGVHRSTWSDLENARLADMTLSTIRRCLDVLSVRLDLSARWSGANLDRLLDEDHAALQAAWAQRLQRWGFVVRVEVSFNHFGDRGRVDLLAWQAALGIIVVVEIKSDLVDAQGLLGPLDVKVRLGPRLAASAGWGRPQRVVPLLIIRDGSTVRDRLRRLDPLFATFAVRGRRAVSCLRHPETITGPMLILSDLRTVAHSRVTRIGGQRVRLPKVRPSTKGRAPTAAGGSRPV